MPTRDPADRASRLTTVKGSSVAKKSPADRWKRPHRYRFWGLPTGVAMLPRLAAAVWRITVGKIRRRSPASSRIWRVKGTKVISATSLVMSMEEKKGSNTSSSCSRRTFFSPASSRWDSTRNTPQRCSPATTAIRHSSRHSTRRSIYPRYAAEGGTAMADTAAHTAAVSKTTSPRHQARNFFTHMDRRLN